MTGHCDVDEWYSAEWERIASRYDMSATEKEMAFGDPARSFSASMNGQAGGVQ